MPLQNIHYHITAPPALRRTIPGNNKARRLLSRHAQREKQLGLGIWEEENKKQIVHLNSGRTQKGDLGFALALSPQMKSLNLSSAPTSSPESPLGDVPSALRRWIRPSFWALLALSFATVSYAAFFSDQFRWSTVLRSDDATAAASSFSAFPPSNADGMNSPTSPTNISHVFFGIGGSAATWEKRKGYSELWWRPRVMKGYAWFDREPPGATSWPATSPPYRVSEDANRFGPRVAAARIARILKEAYRAMVAEGMEDVVRWLVMGDDDTVFFPENLVAVLRKYDHREMYYVGGVSESVEQDVMHSYGIAFGGGGFAVSVAAAREVARVLDGCLVRYARFWGSDQRVHACMTELGVPLTTELGFHQVDIRGDPYGLLAGHPVAPVVTLHHLDYVDRIFPDSATQLQALGRLVNASRVDPARTLQQSFCYEPRLNWSVSVSWGYAAHIYPSVVTPNVLETPLQTFKTWRSWQGGPFTFNTRPVGADACDRPVAFFLHRVRRDTKAGVGSVTEYRRQAVGQRPCKRPEFKAASKVQDVRVIAPVMDPDDWRRAPRRRCCEARKSRWGKTMEVHIRRCRHGETIFSQP